MMKNRFIEQPGTDFQKKVWKTVCRIPAGKTWTYGQLAKVIGHPGAARAVGSALSKNRHPIIIPCHRVVPASGGVGGYALGSAKKKKLLENEKKAASKNK